MHHFDHCGRDNFARLCDSNKQTVNSWWLHAGFFLILEKSDAYQDAVFLYDNFIFCRVHASDGAVA